MNLSTRVVALHNVSGVRRYAVQSAKKSHDLHKTQAGKVKLEQTKLVNGLTIIALENNSPISRVGVIVRAGARFEGPGQLGISHALRNSAGLSTKTSTTFGITRNIDYLGGTLQASATREDLLYLVEALRDSISVPMSYLADTVTRPVFKPWEIEDNSFRLEVDRHRMKKSPEVRLIELLHKAAFSSGLSNSLFAPSFMIEKYDHDLLNTYFSDHFTTTRMAVVGVGVELSSLLQSVERTFDFNVKSAPEIVKPKFVAGNIRKNIDTNAAYVAVAAEGPSAKNTKEVVALSLFQHILGTGSRIKYSEGRGSPLGSAAAQGTQHPFALSGIHINYSDTGLFGFAVGADGGDIHNVVKNIVKKMREVSKGLNEEQLKIAKHQLKAGTLIALENQSLLLEDLGVQALNGGALQFGNSLDSLIDSVTLNEVKDTASKVLKGKVAIASIGQTQNVPYIDDLV